MGTVYSQIMILGSRDVASGRAQRLGQDIADQVQALQDVVETMDEVYQAGTDPLGLGLAAPAQGTAARQALGMDIVPFVMPRRAWRSTTWLRIQPGDAPGGAPCPTHAG